MKRMLIDSSHPEETRVVILDNNRIDDFEAETLGKQQLKGNIYIGHVSRVEPSLQAAFITYGGNRNGFLAFGEVHPQFFALKKDEKEALLEEVAAQAARRRGADREDGETDAEDTPEATATDTAEATEASAEAAEEAAPVEAAPALDFSSMSDEERLDAEAAAKAAALADAQDASTEGNGAEGEKKGGRRGRRDRGGKPGRPQRAEARARPQRAEAKADSADRDGGRAHTAPIHRRYRIQDVLKEGQKILVQVVKEERGSKGAALTTYFSLPGRYTVLMPNTPYAGGISRKITDPEERRALRDAYKALHVPDTMGLIIRTAGLGQEIGHITRDYENLTNLWQHIIKEFEDNDDIQCIHEDGSVVIRALRDMMSDDIEEIIVSGPRAYKLAKDYAKNLMPDLVKAIKQHKEETPLFTAFKVETKLNQLHHTRVTLPSGGYLVINPTEALVSVDINSGRATQERNIEETALKTNLEACDELARQIRLRDLAGLIVVDFIDMEDNRNVRKVENTMRKALRRDRARIQSANISEFGLMEISRQRLRPSFGESHFVACPHCLGTGWVASHATAALMLLRRLEEDDTRGADRIIVTTSTDLVMWLLNNKRDLIRTLEERAKYKLLFRADDSVVAPDFKLELVRIKSDGTETTQILDVVLREQPELPPELRMKAYERGERRRDDRDRKDDRRDRDDRKDDKRDEKKDGQRNEKRGDKRPARTEAAADQPTEGATEAEAPARKGRGRKENAEGRAEAGSRRPRRIGEDAPAETAAVDTPSDAEAQPKGRRRGRREDAPAEAKPTAKQEAKAQPKAQPKPERPARVDAPAEDKPLAVVKVAAEAESSIPATPLPPRKKVEIKKQADTDAADAPLAVAKVTQDDTAAKPAEGKSGGLLSRLLNGR